MNNEFLTNFIFLIYSSKSPLGGLMITKLFFISINGTISLTKGIKTFFWFLNSSIISKLFFSFSKLITFPIIFNLSFSKVLTSRFKSSNKWNSSFFNLGSLSVLTRILNFLSCSAWFLLFIPWSLTTKAVSYTHLRAHETP